MASHNNHLCTPSTMSPGPSSMTLTLRTLEGQAVSNHQEERVVLRLRRKKKVSWQAGVIDNELLNKKSSKKCCIYHKQRAFDESSSDEEDEGQGKSPKGGKQSHCKDCEGTGHSHSGTSPA
eukprot:TRINITY_DN3072_c0_g1_i1.p2 TRINITY_DN3072_c0_g1~~TRINITY_DN3072_c0_g1_i1.p2  ORF type:complete len:121 (-),score=21.21 TRINITY_DN3072_c0_g1_i1:168-530(-)